MSDCTKPLQTSCSTPSILVVKTGSLVLKPTGQPQNSTVWPFQQVGSTKYLEMEINRLEIIWFGYGWKRVIVLRILLKSNTSKDFLWFCWVQELMIWTGWELTAFAPLAPRSTFWCVSGSSCSRKVQAFPKTMMGRKKMIVNWNDAAELSSLTMCNTF